MTHRLKLLLCLLSIIACQGLNAQNTWPREIKTEKDTVITLFQPQPESLKNNKLISRTVVSVKLNKKAEPVFGVMWTEATLGTNLDTRTATLERIKITDVKAPEGTTPQNLARFKELVEREVPKWNLVMSLDDIVATLEEDNKLSSDDLSTKAPDIIYTDKLSTLVLIDGDPILKKDESLKLDKVFNTPFLIVKDPSDNKFYLYAGKFWYSSASLENGWEVVSDLPKGIKDYQKSMEMKEIEKKEKSNKDKNSKDQPVAEEPEAQPATAIVVKTRPTELLQSDGEAKYTSIEGTGLLYVSNSPDNIFKVIEDQSFFIVITGRWYKSASLKGPWSYVPSDKLPADFARIPQGSEKDIVLANVAGTEAARQAVQEAKVPQTAKVDRKNTTCTATYDGEPKFEKIENTDLEMAMNASITVLRSGSIYYAVDNGVWFTSKDAKGPWEVSEERPKGVDKIPPQSPAYNTKYVYVYDVTPEYVYMGYTPGYMGCYVYGPTVIYGTGYPYAPWCGSIYYPYPVTYGYGMCYNPYVGWNMAVGFTMGFFMAGAMHGCYWGPPYCHPPYPHYPPGHYPGYGARPPGSGGGGYYGRPGNGTAAGNRPSTQPSANRNLYNQRNGVSTRDVSRGSAGNRNQVSNGMAGSGTRDLNGSSGNRASNNMYSDKAGNVYRNDRSGNWQQNNGNGWQQNRSNNTQQLDRSQQMRNSGYNRQSNYNSMGSMNRGGGGFRGGGGRR